MHNFSKAIIILACVSVVLASQNNKTAFSTEQQSIIEKAVLKTHIQMTQADKNLDAKKFFSYILDFNKGLIIQDGQMFQTRQEAFEVI